MNVGHILRKSVDIAHADESALVAARRMAQRGVGSLVVVDQVKKPVGFVTDRDIVVRLVSQGRSPPDTPVRAIMTAKPESILASVSLETALLKMEVGGFRRLPVVDEDGLLAGIVTLDDIVAALGATMARVSGVIRAQTPELAACSPVK